MTKTLEVLPIVSLGFSCLFMVELLASVWAFGAEYAASQPFRTNRWQLTPNSYFRSKFHCFDALVIIAGFVIDILTTGVIEEVASLVVVFRLWRVFKIIEELSLGAEEQMEDLRRRLEELERENNELKNEITQSRDKKRSTHEGRS